MARRKQIYYKKLSMNGIYIDNKCPECEGDGFDFLDFTNARGGYIVPQLCGMCEGKGLIDESIIDVQYDDNGNRYIVYKEEDRDDGYRRNNETR